MTKYFHPSFGQNIQFSRKRQSTHLAFITVEGISFEDTRVNNNKAIRAMGARGVAHTY
ncbi:MAG: hypothetical protein ACXV2A_04685 [Halobacteriota archaeon]